MHQLHRRMKRLLLPIFLIMLAVPALGQTYPSESYQLSENGDTLKKWVGSESHIDMTTDPVLSNVKVIGYWAFGREYYDVHTLESIIISESVTSIGQSAFSGCSSLTSITIPNAVRTIENSTFSNCSSLVSITIPYSVRTIEDRAFYNCTSLASVTIPNSVRTIGHTVFSNCSSLASVTIPNSVTSIGPEAFSGCSSLASVILPNSMTGISRNMFSGCSSLVSISIPNTIRHIDSDAFFDCSSLTSITLPYSLYIDSRAFSGCSSLTSVVIPNSVGYDRYLNIGNNAFSGCSNLAEVIATNIRNIYANAFSGCSSLTTIDISNANTIGESAFEGCISLTSLTLSSNISRIEGYTFYDCTGLSEITIPGSVEYIGANAFSNCTGLKSVTSLSTAVPTAVDNVFDNVDYANCTLNVPLQSLELYKADTPWSYFGSIIGQHSVNIGQIGFATLFLPEAAAIPDNVKAYVVSGQTETHFNLTEITDGVIPANTGVVLEAEQGEYIFESTELTSSLSLENLLTGVTTYTELPVGNYVLQAHWDNSGVGFYRTDNAGHLAANKAYIPGERVSSTASFLDFNFNDLTSVISATADESDESNTAYYDMQGRRVVQPKSGSIYVTAKGRKVIFK